MALSQPKLQYSNVITKRLFYGGVYCLYLIIVVTIIFEIILRVYNPFEFRQKGDSIVLPRNRKMIFTNNSIPVIEKRTVHTKNSLGFRGPEPPKPLDSYHKIFVVGGSATECFFLSDSNCWTNRLYEQLKKKNSKVWINNAGFQGHSTYGHSILINQYLKQFHPDEIFMMIGYNEINRDDIHDNESVSKDSKKTTTWGWLKRNSEVINIILNLERYVMADRLSVTDGYVNLNNDNNQQLFLNDKFIDSMVQSQQKLVLAFQSRLTNIVDTCRKNNIHLTLITQPILFGDGFDELTGANLETYKISSNSNGKLIWHLLEEYNNITRKIAKEKNIKLIDLAHLLPKSSLYFYDICHFSNEGSKKVSEIVEISVGQPFVDMK